MTGHWFGVFILDVVPSVLYENFEAAFALDRIEVNLEGVS
jgi:hypothetical protein